MRIASFGRCRPGCGPDPWAGGSVGAKRRPQAAADKAKQSEIRQAKKAEELSDTAKATSGPAGNPECVWLGTRVANLLWRQDMDTAFRHLDVYDRFGCPGGHIQATFRCLVRHGNTIDPKVPELPEQERPGLLG